MSATLNKPKLKTETKIINSLAEGGVANAMENSSDSGVVISANGTHYVRFHLHFAEYDFCCGMREIGGLDILCHNIPEELFVDLMIKHLKRLMEKKVDEVGDHQLDNQTLGFTVTIPYEKEEYRLFLKAIDKIGFNEAMEFKNKNSGNRLKHFVYVW
jgi:hypothetical protein